MKIKELAALHPPAWPTSNTNTRFQFMPTININKMLVNDASNIFLLLLLFVEDRRCVIITFRIKWKAEKIVLEFKNIFLPLLPFFCVLSSDLTLLVTQVALYINRIILVFFKHIIFLNWLHYFSSFPFIVV